ncbi:MAG: DegT/DnrJ/EryC1/StrS family aminotransferase [Anaerolineae bacterium]
MRVPMSSPDVNDDDRQAVLEVLQTPYLSLGPRLAAFEAAAAEYVGSRFATAVNSGTAGLHLAIIAAGVGENDLVITTPFSFVASANCILYERGIPIFVDVDRRTGNMDPEQTQEAVEALLAGGSAARRWLPPALRGAVGVRLGSPRAILPVHAFGQPADMDPLMSLARKYDLAIIEDACEAIGARYKQRMAGTLGDAGVFAFYPNKQMTTGEGGVIVTDREDWDTLFRSLRNQGRDVFDAWLNHSRLGYNYRLDEMSAALGLSQLRRLDELLEKRQRVADWYRERLADIPWIITPYIAPTTTRMSWFVYVVRVTPPADRNAVMAHLEEQGIPSRPYFSPIHLQPFYRQRFGYGDGDFPVTEELGQTCLALPFSSVMREEEVDLVCEALRRFGRGM